MLLICDVRGCRKVMTAWLVASLFLLFSGEGGAGPETELAKRVLELTGSRTKIIWKRGSRDDFGKLMCFDTAEGVERTVVDRPDFCKNPYIAKNGACIVFTGPAQTAYVVDWDGSNLKPLTQGQHYYVLGTYRDEGANVDWIYLGNNYTAEAGGPGAKATSVYRCRLDKPEVRELLWDKTTIADRFCVGPGGLQAASELPRPLCSVAQFPNGGLKTYGEGCCANIAPDGSGRFFHLIGDHRNIALYTEPGKSVKVALNGAPGVEKDPERKIWRPKWSNHARFISLQTSDLGTDADVAVGRFDEKFSRIEKWVRVTDTTDYDADTIVWIKPLRPLGVKITDNLDIPVLQSGIMQLETAAQVKPVYDRFKALAANKSKQQEADAAQDVVEHVARWADRACEDAKRLESVNPHEAGRAYKLIAGRFNGLRWGDLAAERIKDQGLIREAKAWTLYLKAEQAASGLQEVPGAEARVTDQKWMAKNRLRVTQLEGFAKALSADFQDTIAFSRVSKLLETYGVDLK